MEEASVVVLTLSEGLEPHELLGSRLTRAEVRRQLLRIASALGRAAPERRGVWPELDWDAWSTTAARIERGGQSGDDALWFAVTVLTPATLSWLRIYRSGAPDLPGDTVSGIHDGHVIK